MKLKLKFSKDEKRCLILFYVHKKNNLKFQTSQKIATSKTTFASKVDNHQYANTMNLPKTEFPLRSKPQDVQKTISLASYIYQTQVNFNFNGVLKNFLKNLFYYFYLDFKLQNFL